MQVTSAVAVPVFLGKAERGAKCLATRDDRDLVQRIRVLQHRLDDGVARLVIRGGDSFLFLDPVALAGSAEPYLVACLLEVDHLHGRLVRHGRKDRGLVDDRGKVGAGKHGRAPGQAVEVDVGAGLYLLRVHLQDLVTADEVGQRHDDLSVEPTGTRQRRVENVGSVRRRDNDDLVVGLEAVHLDEDGVEGLLTLVVPAAGESCAAAPPDGIDLIEEDDARRILLGLLEQVADTRGADTDEHLDEVGAADREKRHVGFTGNRLRQKRLTATGRAHEQNTAGDAPTKPLKLLRCLEEFYDLLDLFLGLLDAGDVSEGVVGVFLRSDAVARP